MRWDVAKIGVVNPILRDLLDHQFWADSQHWSAVAALPQAQEDRDIRARLHHIHLVQRMFIWAIGDRARTPAPTSVSDFPSFEALFGFARESHAALRATLERMTDVDFERPVTMPWFPAPPLTISTTEALTQMATHSLHHRGQNLARLRELGATPPTLDLIVWYWKGRPVASL
jgi:uncharacterized damage-inducible protein DinB